MSRIGRHPIAIPAGVTVTVSDDNHVVVKGPKGQLEQTVNKNITVKVEGNEVHVTRPNDEKQNRAFHGLYRALIANMVTGVTEGYKKTLALVGTGYRAEAKGDTLNITIGYSHPVIMKAPQNMLRRTRRPSRSPASTSSRWATSRPTSVRSAARNRTTARASVMRMRLSVKRKARPVRSKGVSANVYQT